MRPRPGHAAIRRPGDGGRPVRLLSPLLLAVSACLTVCAAHAGSSGEDSPAPVFVLATVRGETVTGPLEELGEDWSVALGGAKPGRGAGDDILSLRRARMPLPHFPEGEQVILANGDRLPGTVLRLAGERLGFRLETAPGAESQQVSMPLSAVSVLWLTSPAGTDRQDVLRRKLARERRRRDTVYLRNGDVLEGILAAFDRSGDLRIEVGKKPVKVPFRNVAAVGLSTALARAPRTKEAYGHLVLHNGCRLALTSARADGQALTGKTLFGAQVRVPVREVRGLDLYQGRSIYLSDLKPRAYEFRSYLGGPPLPYVHDGSALDGLDGSVAGGDLRLGRATYDKGLGMRSQSRITYALAGGYRQFEALVGLDDLTGQAGSARVKVLVDGKARDLGWEGELSWSHGPRSVRLDVNGGRELTLVVDFGRRGCVQNHVDWADARLVR